MKQLVSPQPFLDIVTHPYPGTPGRWSNLRDGTALLPLESTGSSLESYPIELPLNAVNTISHLLDGSAKISYFAAQADPAILVELTGPEGQPNKYLYRLRSNQIYTNTPFGQDVEALILFAVRLLIHRDTNFSLWYLRLLRDLAQGISQAKLDKTMSTVVFDLLRACWQDFNLDQPYTDLVWFYSVRTPQDEDIVFEMFSDQGVEGLTEIFSDAGKFAQYWDGEINLPSQLRVAF